MIKRQGKNSGVNKKKVKKKSLMRKILILFVFMMLMFSLSYFLLFSPFFNILKVEVKGAISLDPQTILEVADINVGENIFLQNNVSRENNIKKSYNIIEDIKIKQSLPNKVIIDVQEKKPILTLLSNSKYILIGNNGEVIDIKDKLNQLAIPLLTGISLSEQVAVGQVIADSDVIKIVKLLETVNDEKKFLFGEIAIVDDQIIIFPTSSYKVIIGDSSNLEKKLIVLEALITDTNILVNSIDYIDITNPEKIIKKTKEGIS